MKIFIFHIEVVENIITDYCLPNIFFLDKYVNIIKIFNHDDIEITCMPFQDI